MTTFDEHKNLALGVVSAGSGVIDSTSGTTIVASSDAEAAEFPAVPFFVTVWRDQTPTQPAVEIMRATAFDGAKTFTVAREQQGTTAQPFISQGWKFGNTITVADIAAIEEAVTGGEAGLAAETAARESADATLQSNIGAEATARVAGDAATLSSAEAYADTHDAATLAAAETYTDGKVATEASSRVAGDAATLATAEGYTDGEVSSEASTRAAADSTLQGHIDAEATARASGDAATLASSETYADGKVAAEAALRVTGDSTTLAAAEAYTDAKVVAGVRYRGAIDASTNPNLPAASLGDLYAISVAGTVSGVAVEAGDMALCKIDGTPGNTPANWDVVQTNINGAVTGPVSATDADFALFNGSSGKVLKDGGLSLDTDATLAADSDSRLPSQRAAKTYIDALVAAEASARASAVTAEAASRVAGDIATFTAIQTAAAVALAVGQFALLDCTSNNIAATLPSNPPDGSRLAVKLVASPSGFVATIGAGSGDAIFGAGGGSSFSLRLVPETATLQFRAANRTWYVQSAEDSGVLAAYGVVKIQSNRQFAAGSGNDIEFLYAGNRIARFTDFQNSGGFFAAALQLYGSAGSQEIGIDLGNPTNPFRDLYFAPITSGGSFIFDFPYFVHPGTSAGYPSVLMSPGTLGPGSQTGGGTSAMLSLLPVAGGTFQQEALRLYKPPGVGVGNALTHTNVGDTRRRLQALFTGQILARVNGGANGTTRAVSVATTNGSPSLVAAAATFTQGDVQSYVTGAGIPAGAAITAVSSDGTTATISVNATATASGVAVTVYVPDFALWTDDLATPASVPLLVVHRVPGVPTFGIGGVGGAGGHRIGFYGTTPTAQLLLATGALHTVDDVITALQTLGLVRQA